MTYNLEVLRELKKIADKLWVNLSDLIFDSGESIILIKNDEKLEGSIGGDQIVATSKFDRWKLISKITIPDNFVSKKPLHFCFVLDKSWAVQDINAEWYIWKNAKVRIFAYCLSLDANAKHIDNKKFFIKQWWVLENYEFHYYWGDANIYVETNVEVFLEKDAKYINEFISTVGKLGEIKTTNKIYCRGENSSAEVLTKADIKDWDKIWSNTEIHLIWTDSRWLLRSKSITREGWTNIFDWKIIWKGDYCKWHIECDEISLGKCKIVTKPQLIVENPHSWL